MVIARNQITITDIHDGQPSYTYTRYSNDEGKTFTESPELIKRLSSWECRKYGVSPIEYVGNNNGAYTRTGILGADDVVMEIVVLASTIYENYCMMAGCRTQSPHKEMFIGTYKKGGRVWAAGWFGNISSQTLEINGNAVCSYKISRDGFYVNGKKASGTPVYAPGSVPNNEMVLGSWNDNGAIQVRIQQKIYYFHAKSESQGKDMELFPVVNSDGAVGLFDRIGKKFHSSEMQGRNYLKGQDTTPDDTFGTTPGSWMGTVTWDKPYPPFDVTAYTWSKIKGEDGAPGTPAELYRLKAITERAVVNEEGMLSVALQYAIEHTVGNNVTTLPATVGGYRVRWHGDNGTPGNSYLTDGDRPSATYTMAGYHNNQHRPSAVVVELVKGNTILDVKTVPVVFDAAASVTTAKDLSAITTTVQGHSKTLLGQAQQISNLVVGLDGIKGSVQSVEGSLKNYSTLEQTANGFKLMAKAVQQGLHNLLKGGNLHTTYYSYGMAESLTIDLEGGHTYTMTANGHVSQRIKDRHMDMRVMIFNKEWTHLKIIVIDSTTDTTASVTWDDMPTGQYFINAFPMPNDANNRDTITLNWVTVTEGNVPMSQWRTTEAEEDEAWVGMGIDRKNKSIDMHADKFSLHNTNGEQILGMNKDGDMEVKGTVEASVLLRKFAFIDLPVEPYGRTLTYDKEHTKVTGYTERIPPDIIVLRKIGSRPKEDAPTLYLPYAGHCKGKMIDIYGPTSFGYFGAFFIKAILNDAYFPDGELEFNGYIEGENGFFTINGEKIAAPRYDGHSFALLGTDGYNRIQVGASGGENPTISMVKLQSVEKDNGQWVWAIFDMRNCTLK